MSSRNFASRESLHHSFVVKGIAVESSIIVDDVEYVTESVDVGTEGMQRHLVSSTGQRIVLEWSCRGAMYVPDRVSFRPTDCAFESATVITELPKETQPNACEIHAHRANIAGIRMQARVDESVMTPTLFLRPDQLVVSERDPESQLPVTAALIDNGVHVMVYEHEGELMIPSIEIETIEGCVLHDVRVRLEQSECPHLALPPNLRSS